jgi:L-ascorbate metabolism protein UlaG (beta-lactamase superfamily)
VGHAGRAPRLRLLIHAATPTKDPADAAYALRELIKPKFAIPMHYGANPLGKGTPPELQQALGDAPVKVLVLKPGEKAEF